GAYSTESAVAVKLNFCEAIRKIQRTTTSYHSLHRLQRCPSPAADAYFTVYRAGMQPLRVEKI
ncbi:hypothetical protein QC758_18875, partial [Halomonas campisalis]|uniref:hypothetical protein n=1 Tax=Billgrantia campisalis TaxID=74661 RepID=UPI0028557402